MPLSPLAFPLAQAHGGFDSRQLVDHLARTPLSQVVIFVVVLTVIRLAIYPMIRNTVAHKRSTGYAAARFGNELLDALIYAGVFVFMLIRPFGVQAFLIPSGSMWPTLYVNDLIVANKAIYRYSDPKPNDVVVFRPPATAKLKDSDLDAQGEMTLDFIKRCIGAPGDVIEMKKGVLYRNGQVVEEPYKAYSRCTDATPQEEDNCQQFSMFTADEIKSLSKASFKLVKYHDEIIPLNYSDLDANAPAPQRSFTDDDAPYHVATKFQIADLGEEKKAEALPAEKVPPGMYLMMGDNRNNSYDGRAWGLVPRDQIIGRAEFVWWPLTRIHRTP